MKEYIIHNLTAGNTVTFSDILFKLVVVFFISLIMYLAYYCSSSKLSYNGSFNFSLVAMSIITTAIMAVISSNIALSLGMVGALSIIRFRTAIKDPRDAMFIFWSIMVGICCGVAQYIIAMVTSAVLFLFFLCIRVVRDDKRYILVIRCDMAAADTVKAITYQHYPNSRISVENTSRDSVEFIYELKHFKATGNTRYLQELYTVSGVEYANFVLQEDTANV